MQKVHTYSIQRTKLTMCWRVPNWSWDSDLPLVLTQVYRYTGIQGPLRIDRLLWWLLMACRWLAEDVCLSAPPPHLLPRLGQGLKLIINAESSEDTGVPCCSSSPVSPSLRRPFISVSSILHLPATATLRSCALPHIDCSWARLSFTSPRACSGSFIPLKLW